MSCARQTIIHINPQLKPRRLCRSPRVSKARNPALRRELLVSQKPLLPPRPHQHLEAKAQSPANAQARAVSTGPGYVHWQRTERIIGYWCAFVAIWSTFFIIQSSHQSGIVPISGRKRSRGPVRLNDFLDEELREELSKVEDAQERFFPGDEGPFPDDVRSAANEPRARRLLERIAVAAGLERMPFHLRSVAQTGEQPIAAAWQTAETDATQIRRELCRILSASCSSTRPCFELHLPTPN